MTESLSERIVRVALSQVGERERAPNVTVYHDWYDSYGTYRYSGQPWCAIFVCWVLDRAGARLPTIQGTECGQYPGAASVQVLRSWFGQQRWVLPFEEPPRPGDIAIHTWPHIGIVVAFLPTNDTNCGYVVSVEGNTGRCGHESSERVALRIRPTHEFITFVRVPENFSSVR